MNPHDKNLQKFNIQNLTTFMPDKKILRNDT